MPDSTTKRRREKYSKLICLGCRARRIRCALPDYSIQPSSQPQPRDKACQRCVQNVFPCVVDSTTLGRPAQKRNCIDQASNQQQFNQSSDTRPQNGDFEDTASRDVEGFLLSHPQENDDDADFAAVHQLRPTKSEICEAVFSQYHLLGALLSRDKQFASSIGAQSHLVSSVLDKMDDQVLALLDSHLVWHKFFYSDIPSLLLLREEIRSLERGQPERTSALFLLTLLCDMALDVPSPQLSPYINLQPALRSLLYHWGQQLLFSLPRNKYTVLALVIATEYRPLAFTGSQAAGPSAIKAVPHAILAKHVAFDLGYHTAGSRLAEALQQDAADRDDLTGTMHECLHWIRLGLAQESLAGASMDPGFRFQDMNQTAFECQEALHTTLLMGCMPEDMLISFCNTSKSTQMLASLKDASEHWKELSRLEQIMGAHKELCDREKKELEHSIDTSGCHVDLSNAVLHIAEMERHRAQTSVVGAALFFAVMCGAYAASNQRTVQPDQAMELSDHIIDQLQAHKHDDPNRPHHRRFLEEFGESWMGELERTLTNFITAADTLSLDGIPYVGPSRHIASSILFLCKDIVEGNAARLKGWGGLHDNIDLQMIMFNECARRLEAMSSSAGTNEALASGCILTATAKLIRSLHRILQGFKTTLAASRRRGAPASAKVKATPSSAKTGMERDGFVEFNNTSSSAWDSIMSDDLFSDWDNWPQFDAFDFPDLFGSALSGEPPPDM